MSDSPHPDRSRTNIVIVSGSCCIPGMAAFDEQARRVVDQAVSETGVQAQVAVIPATTAMMGGVSKDLIARLVTEFNESGRVGLPAILVNGEAVSYGVPTVEDLKSALLKAAATTRKEG